MGEPNDRRKFAAFLTDYVDYGVAMATLSIATYLPMFLKENGASPVVIGLIPATFALGRAVTGLLAAPYLERQSLIRRRMMMAMAIERLPIFLCGMWICVAPDIAPELTVAGVLSLWILYNLGNGWASTSWGAFVARVLAVQERGRLNSLGTPLSALCGLAVAFAVRESIARFGLSRGYGGAVAVAGLLLMASSLVFLRVREEPFRRVKQQRRLGVYFREMGPLLRGDGRFRWFMAVVSLWLAAITGASYFTVYAMHRFAAGPTAVMGYTIVLTLGAGMAGLVGGAVANRKGYARVFLWGLGGTTAAMLVAFLGPWAWCMYLAFALAGAASSACMMGVVYLPMEMGGQDNVPTYVGISSLVRAPMGTLAPLLAGVYLQRFPYPPLFVFCALSGVLGALLLARFVGEPRGQGQTPATILDLPRQSGCEAAG